MAQNFLCFNENKTEVMFFTPGGTYESQNFDLRELNPLVKPYVKNLGFTMDYDFKLDKQINLVVKSSFFQLRQLAKVKSFLSSRDFQKLLHIFISSRLDYCNGLYIGISQASLSRLQRVQNAAARLLTGTKKREHITPVLSSLHWLPVSFRINFKILMFVFKSLHGLAPRYMTELIRHYAPSRALRSADHLLLVVPRVKLKSRGERAFSVAGPKLWNRLPLYIRQSQTITIFKSNLKTYYYSLAFDAV